MVNKLRFNIAKFGAKIASQVSKLGFGSGNNLPGYVFYKVAGKEALKDLAHEMNVGPILITGTNGKTTTTTILIKLLSCDTEIRKSFESNTIHAITTGILKGSGDIGVFEYGIRNKIYGIPSQKFLNHRGIYSCECGFKRREPNVKLTGAHFKPDNWDLTIEGNLYNYTNNRDVSFKVTINVPPFGFHNIYNTLASVCTYATFTPKIANIENTIKEVFNNLDMSFIPPGRFEVVKLNDKYVGLGQGDNGDAAKINALFMNQYIDGPLEFIYTTPDEHEEEIFEDHLEVIKNLNPDHIIVVPGRKSIEKAQDYYSIISEEFDNTDFYPLSYEKMDERIKKLVDLAKTSDYGYVIMTGCGEEQEMWENIKQKLINK